MTISDNLSGGTPGSTPPPVNPTPSAVSGGRPKWLIPVIIGVVASVISRLVVEWRTRSRVDDTLDVFPSHGVGGMVGMILTGVFATHTVNEVVTTDGLYFGETGLFTAHVIGLVGAAIFTLVMSFVLLKITDLITKLRASAEDEEIGLDISQHGEKL